MGRRRIYRALHAHLGPCEMAVALEIRRRTPDEALLLYMHPPKGGARLQDCEGTVFAEASPDGAALRKLARTLKELELDDGASVWTSASCGLEKSFGDFLEKARGCAASTMSSIRCAKAGRLLFLRASLRNIPAIIRNGSWHPDAAFQNAGAVVCGAGPSLRTQMEALRRIQGKVAVIAAGRAVKPLLEGGVEPDMVCEIDSVSHVNWSGAETLRCPLLAPPIVSPAVAAHFRRTLWTREGSNFDSLLTAFGLDIPSLPIPRSVGGYALEAALSFFSFGRVALLGMDLCLSPEGATHADSGEAASDGDEGSLLEVPGRDGGKVIANTLFNGIRESLEERLELCGPGRVFNCSAGGAAIAGAEALPLEDFAKSCEAFPFKGSFADAIKESRPGEGKAVELLSRMSDDIEGAPEATPILSIVGRHFESLLRESPPFFLDSAPESARKPLLSLKEGLLSEVGSDLVHALASLSGKPQEGEPEDAHCIFERSLKKFAVELVSKSHRAFGELLERGGTPSSGREWSVHPNYMRLPYVKLKGGDGPAFRLSSHISMEPLAGAEIELFLKETAFDPSRCAAMFIAPGNWAHPVEFAKRLPGARMLVVEPWPELFLNLACRCQFLHRLPPDAMIVGACEELPDWRDILKRRVRHLEADGFTPVLFRHPRTWLLPEASSLAAELASAWKIRPGVYIPKPL